MLKSLKIVIPANMIKGPLNLELTMESKQFTNSNWKRVHRGYRSVLKVDNKSVVGLEVKQQGSTDKPQLTVDISYVNKKPKNLYNLTIMKIFCELGLSYDLDEVYSKFKDDHVAKNIITEYRGLRLIRYFNIEECLITYQLSANTSITRLEQMLEALKQKLGLSFKFKDELVLNTFPDLEQISSLSLKELYSCKLGYKAKFLLQLAKEYHARKINWRTLENLNIIDGRKRVMKLPGVGLKVADAVLLYGLGRTEALPIDVWVKRALVNLYGLNKDLSYVKLQNFILEKFGSYSGYLVPYFFHHSRRVFKHNSYHS
ncbi:MAG: DNA-3-methyladenine glycosylase family protein [Candidatus Bathyarchaeota archaeon]